MIVFHRHKRTHIFGPTALTPIESYFFFRVHGVGRQAETMDDDEPFDAMSRSTSSVPPRPFEYPPTLERGRSAPPANAFGALSGAGLDTLLNRSPSPPSDTHQLPARWKQYETELERIRAASSLANSNSEASEATRRCVQREQEAAATAAAAAAISKSDLSKQYSRNKAVPYSNYDLSLLPNRRASYDTAELIRKYGSGTDTEYLSSYTRPLPMIERNFEDEPSEEPLNVRPYSLRRVSSTPVDTDQGPYS